LCSPSALHGLHEGQLDAAPLVRVVALDALPPLLLGEFVSCGRIRVPSRRPSELISRSIRHPERWGRGGGSGTGAGWSELRPPGRL